MKKLENAKELKELEEKEVAGGHISIVSPGETPNSLPVYLNPNPDVDPNIKTDGFGGPGPAGITYTWDEPKDGGATGGW